MSLTNSRNNNIPSLVSCHCKKQNQTLVTVISNILPLNPSIQSHSLLTRISSQVESIQLDRYKLCRSQYIASISEAK